MLSLHTDKNGVYCTFDIQEVTRYAGDTTHTAHDMPSQQRQPFQIIIRHCRNDNRKHTNPWWPHEIYDLTINKEQLTNIR